MSVENQKFLPGIGPETIAAQSAAVLLIKIENDTPYFLAAKRLNRKGTTIPGGKLEEGETPKEGAIREVLEETDIDIFSDEYLISAHPRRERVVIYENNLNFITRVYFAYFDEATNGEEPINIEPEKHGAWKWIPLSELPNMISAGELHPVLKQDFMLAQIKECIELYPST